MAAPDRGADQTLHVVMNHRVIGNIQRTGKRSVRLRYDEPDLRIFTPLSISMRDPGRGYREAIVSPWLERLLPDRPETVRQWRRQFGVAADDSPFSLLRHVGEDVAGAAQFVRTDRLQAVLHDPGQIEPLDTAQIAEMLRRAKADLPISNVEDNTGTFSLAGAQAKVALHRLAGGWGYPSGSVPSTHIIKPAIPGMADQDLVEAVTMRTAKGLHLTTAACAVAEFDDERAIVVSRYDRVERSGRWIRVHQEDLCQALSYAPRLTHESQGGPSAARVAELIAQVSNQPGPDARRFAQALIFNWLVCGTDAHARNYSILIDRDSVRLAPLYDLNAHLAYSDGTGHDLSMGVAGTFRAARVRLDDWLRAAPHLRVNPDWLREEIGRQARELPTAMAAACTASDIARYEQHPGETRREHRGLDSRPNARTSAARRRNDRPTTGLTNPADESG